MKTVEILNEADWKTTLKKGANILGKGINAATGSNAPMLKTAQGTSELKKLTKELSNQLKRVAQQFRNTSFKETNPKDVLPQIQKIISNIFDISPDEYSNELNNNTYRVARLIAKEVQNDASTFDTNTNLQKNIAQLGYNSIQSKVSSSAPDDFNEPNDDSEDGYKPYGIEVGDIFKIKVAGMTYAGEELTVFEYLDHPGTYFEMAEESKNPNIWGVVNVIANPKITEKIKQTLENVGDIYTVQRVKPKEEMFLKPLDKEETEVQENMNYDSEVYFLARLRDRIVNQDLYVIIEQDLNKKDK